MARNVAITMGKNAGLQPARMLLMTTSHTRISFPEGPASGISMVSKGSGQYASIAAKRAGIGGITGKLSLID